MRYKLHRGSHSVYSLYYHYVQVVKYRRKIFDNENKIIDFLKKLIYEISETFEVHIIEISVDKDHFHMLFKAKQTLNIRRYINTITSREIQQG